MRESSEFIFLRGSILALTPYLYGLYFYVKSTAIRETAEPCIFPAKQGRPHLKLFPFIFQGCLQFQNIQAHTWLQITDRWCHIQLQKCLPFFFYFPPFSRKKECHTFSKAVDITVTLIAFQAIDFIYQVAYKLEYFSYFLSFTIFRDMY